MKSDERLLARKNLDRKLNVLAEVETLARPSRGWLKAIREALGMTAAQFGKRMGVSQPRALEIEKNEIKGTLTLDTLDRAAQALNCRIVYALVPHEPLERMIETRAEAVATKSLMLTDHSMKLEDQGVSEEDFQTAKNQLVRQLIEKSGSELWVDP